ncbi:50S ribosomal protein L23 [Candidatus Acetothermia bacterium]|jgi:large subunit ribosomal protein L23|nr:50S ribosomal protein L23 [Candidatus Acetothermia bacterium]MCI2426415.1 50S ribosomal protein L23 [Candidatus Acetothermia bacterium]MCI2427609.1 50S ribosomal protein L23 [Candidatus Acetothermia bacterium]MCI2428221.1 50S ribosomal protein L23 [Candidatus Acetothermia bacterium]
MAKSTYFEDIIIAPLLTEATWKVMEDNKYAFKVALAANKIQIKRAVEGLFNVKVEKVWTANMEGKPRRERLTQMHGKTNRWRKAIVKLAPGNKIELVSS